MQGWMNDRESYSRARALRARNAEYMQLIQLGAFYMPRTSEGGRRLRENFSALSALSERAAGKKTLVFLDFEILVMSPVNFVFVKRPLSQGKFAQSTQK